MILFGPPMLTRHTAEESTLNAAREIRQDTMQAPPILSAADVAMLNYFFDAPDDFEDLPPATDVTTLRFADAETAVIRDFFQTVEVISARARARAR